MQLKEYFIELEKAALAAWPAAEKETLNNVVLCFADGYTKRANSANVLDNILPNQYQKIVSSVESFYRVKQQPSIFRIPSFCDQSTTDSLNAESKNFDSFLEEQGYYYHHQSLVLEKTISSLMVDDNLRAPNISIEVAQIEDWLCCFNQLQNVANADGKNHNENPHLDILQRIQNQTFPTVLSVNGKPVACALGVFYHQYFGIFDVITHSDERGKGLAQSLLSFMLDWAARQGATNSYLQVMSDNVSARALYKKMGYQQCYSYWYRVKDFKKLD